MATSLPSPPKQENVRTLIRFVTHVVTTHFVASLSHYLSTSEQSWLQLTLFSPCSRHGADSHAIVLPLSTCRTVT